MRRKDEKKQKQRQNQKPELSKHDLRELMGQFDQTLERRHGALRRKGL
jgi:hypothetical protein